ncbi:MAG: DUF2065 family protein [Candidatus Omnitrophica bacterium]|nr:DUF2065 family protein [Candidatus Omnitrophota bacterium]
MEIPALVARLYGPIVVVVAIGLLFQPAYYQKVLRDFKDSSALCYFGGILALFVGLLIVQYHNVWELHWSVLVTLIGWIALIKGVVLVVVPSSFEKWIDKYLQSSKALRIHGVAALILGMILSYFGFSA